MRIPESFCGRGIWEKLRSRNRRKGGTNNSPAILVQELMILPPNRYGVAIVESLEGNETTCQKRFCSHSCNVRQEEI
jgi:hypothetical protein